MSWSVGAQGKKEEVKAQLASQFQTVAHQYAGTDEGVDVSVANDRVMTALEALEPAEGGGVRVTAYGSRSTDGDKLSAMSLHIDIVRFTEPT